MDNPKPVTREFTDRILSYSDWGHHTAVRRLYRASRNLDTAFEPYLPALRELDVPVCVLWSDADAYLPIAWAEKQRATIPHAEIHILPGLGHWPFLDDLEAASPLLLPFLRRVTG